jgi:transposase-like protein
MVRRRKFSDEYKREAVRLATQPGVTKSQVAQELGINANLLGWWCRDYAANDRAAHLEVPGPTAPGASSHTSGLTGAHHRLMVQRA